MQSSKTPNGDRRLNIAISYDLLKRVGIYAKQHDMTIKDFVCSVLDRETKRPAKG